MNHHVRRAGPADAPVVTAMVHELAAHQDQTRHVAVTTDRWRALLGRCDIVVLLAEHGGEPVGYVSALRRPHLWSGTDILALDDLWVRPPARDAGVGRALMVALARHAAPEGHTITWSVQPDNIGAQRFYARLGATLRPNIVSSWHPDAYAPALE
ncbi:GNAT family N-acetyltransferase [Asanoa siamensis]|uniref:N-acetyltransferase n=1 Tax=Asanoa siamensis TaxID=926357 RepID=A0ABQ4D3H1_9ACTN|nr:GNAT family N-acetyltransferase [Asanoa siamensis]GIF78066.1 N-acetyltransferase [Asanoa siamensis]